MPYLSHPYQPARCIECLVTVSSRRQMLFHAQLNDLSPLCAADLTTGENFYVV